MSNSDRYRFNDAEREAVYRAIAERRDMRHFTSDPIDEPTDLALDVGASRQHRHRLVQIERTKRAQLAPDRHPQRVRRAGARCRYKQPRLTLTIRLV